MNEPQLDAHGHASPTRRSDSRRRLRASIEIAAISPLILPLWTAFIMQFEQTRTEQVFVAALALLFNLGFLAASLHVLKRARPPTPRGTYQRTRIAVWLLIATGSALCMGITFGPGRELVSYLPDNASS